MNAAEAHVTPSMIGRVLTRTVPTLPLARYQVFLAPQPTAAPILVAVHGISRDPGAVVSALMHTAQREGYTLIAPHFDARTYLDFQRLGRQGLGARADLALNAMLGDARATFGLHGPMHLFGFSGGAQFAHRYVCAWPKRFETLTLTAAGWYTTLSTRRRFPAGLGATPRLCGLQFDVRALLATPTHVIVGERDTLRDEALRQTPAIDRRQGRNRVERAAWFYDQLVRRSRRAGLAEHHAFTVLPNCEHDVVEAAVRGNLARHLFDFCQRRVGAGPVQTASVACQALEDTP